MIFPMAMLVFPTFILEMEPWARPVRDIWNFSHQSWGNVLYPPGVAKAGRLWFWSCQRPHSPPYRERPSVRGRDDSNEQERREREKLDGILDWTSKSSHCWGQLHSVRSMIWLCEPINPLFVLKVVRVGFLSLLAKNLWLIQISSAMEKMRSFQRASQATDVHRQGLEREEEEHRDDCI